MPIQRRAAAAPPPPVEGVNFLDWGFYTAGSFVLPVGKYSMSFDIVNFQPTNAQGVSRGPSRLGVMVTARSLTDPAAQPHEQFYSMGTNAHLSYAPDPVAGKKLIPIPGGPGAGLSPMSNWALLFKSLLDCDPEIATVASNDLSVLDGIWVQTMLIDQPEERKSIASRTGEAAENEPRRDSKIAVVSEILEGGKPWEGGGGTPEAGAAPAAKVAPIRGSAIAPKPPAARVAARVAPAPVAAASAEEDLQEAALNALTKVLEANENGMAKLKLKTLVYKAAGDDDLGAAIAEQYFSSDDALNSILAHLGFVVSGVQVKPL